MAMMKTDPDAAEKFIDKNYCAGKYYFLKQYLFFILN
jgi:hypothetical protein